MSKFDSTLFEWGNHRVRLGRFWKTTEANLCGGQSLSRAAIINSGVLEVGVGKNEWNINPELSPSRKSELISLLESFSDVFAKNPKAPNVTHLVNHKINTDRNQPVRSRVGRVSPQAEGEIERQVQEMLKNNIIRPSCSPWGSRVILITKKDGGVRFAVDYRALNSITRKDSYPFPDINGLLDKLHGSGVFTTMDGAAAYWSIPLDRRDISKTAFVTPCGQYEFLVMPFGLCNAPATYQRVIDLALHSTPFCLPYLDDALTHSQNFP